MASHTLRSTLLPGSRATIDHAQRNDRRYGGHFVLTEGVWWATLDSNQ